MISDLTAAIALNNRNIARHQQMFCFSRLALRKYRQVFDQPDLIRGVSSRESVKSCIAWETGS
jgi:hypothetical protein